MENSGAGARVPSQTGGDVPCSRSVDVSRQTPASPVHRISSTEQPECHDDICQLDTHTRSHRKSPPVFDTILDKSFSLTE